MTNESILKELEDALNAVTKATRSHIDGRDLLDELHPRYTLDIKRRRDGVETWYQGDWLSNLREAMKLVRKALTHLEEARKGGGDMPDVIKFLLGEDQLDGYSFGEFPDNGEQYKKRYWWRKALRKLYEPTNQGGSDEIIR